MNYPSNEFKLKLSGDHKVLRVLDRISGAEENDFDLENDTVTVSLSGEDYMIEAGDRTDPYYDLGLDILGGDTFKFEYKNVRSQAGGIGIIDIRDINGAIQTVGAEVTFHLDKCPISLQYQSGVPKNFHVLVACDPNQNCETISPNCHTYREV